MCFVRLFIALTAAVFAATPVSADSWSPPETRSYETTDGAWRLTIEPPPIESALEYFTEEFEAERTGSLMERPAPLAIFERRQSDGRYVQLWATSLINTVAPVDAIIASDGSYVVTLDNWHSMGLGENVVVIYDSSGELLHALQLSDFLPDDYLSALPRSVSSLHWRREARIENRFLKLEVVVPNGDLTPENTIEFAINMATGEAVPTDAALWAEALHAAEVRNEAQAEAASARVRYLTEPLGAPAGTDGREWHSYLREAFLRLTPIYLDSPVPDVQLFVAMDHERHAQSLEWFIEAFVDAASWGTDGIVIAAPGADDALVDSVRLAVAAVPTGSLAETSIYVSVPASLREAIARMLLPTGAKFVWLDPSGVIPQRAERIPGSDSEAAAQAEMMRRMSDELAAAMSELDADDAEGILDESSEAGATCEVN